MMPKQAEDCCCGTVYNHCRVAGIRLRGKGKSHKQKPGYAGELQAGVIRYGSKRAMVRHMEKFGWY